MFELHTYQVFQQTSWLGVRHDIDSYELDCVTPIWHYFSQWKIIIIKLVNIITYQVVNVETSIYNF